MGDDKILNDLNRSSKKKTKIVIAIVAILIIGIITACAVFWFTSKKDSLSKKQKNNGGNTVYDTTLLGDASLDPENLDLQKENGLVVTDADLKASENNSNGIDVSKWQGKIDWQKAKESGVQFAFIRIGYRGEDGVLYKDDTADYNIQQAQNAGVLVGVYFFSTATSKKEAKEEAEWTAQAIEKYSISYPVVYDCEGFTLSDSRMHDLTAAKRTDNALTFMKTIKNAGYEPMFYSSLNEMKDSKSWEMDRIEKNYKIWVAQYASTAYPQKEKPDYDGACHAWQYTNKGNISGITGNVDMVVCYFTKEKAEPKNKKEAPEPAKAPLTEEEKLYTAANEQVTAKEETNLRAAATTKSNIVATLKNGDAANRIGVGKNGWSKLEYNGQTVYAITSYLTTDFSFEPTVVPQNDVVSGNTFTSQSDRVTAKEEVNLRTLPTTDSDIVGKLVSGEFLDRTAVSDKGWSRLNYNGQTVYAVTSYLSTEVISQEPQAPAESADGFSSTDEQVTAKSETNLRTSPSTDNSEVVYTLKNGEYVRRIGIHTNGWSKLEYNGQTVYAISSYLTTE